MHADVAAKDKLLNEHLNAAVLKCTDTAQLTDLGKQSRKAVHSVIKSVTRNLPRIRTAINETSVTELQRKICYRDLICLVKISTCRKY